jgi:hypothetical protein
MLDGSEGNHEVLKATRREEPAISEIAANKMIVPGAPMIEATSRCDTEALVGVIES